MRDKLILGLEKTYPVLFLLLCFSATIIKPIAIASVVLVIAVFILQLLLGDKLLCLKSWSSFFVLQFILIVALSLLYTENMQLGSRGIRVVVIALISSILIIKLPGKAMAHRLLTAFIAGGSMLSLIIVYQGLIKHIVRPKHVWMEVHAGNLLLFTLVATVSLILAAESLRSRLLYAALIILQLYALYLNGTRGAWIAFAAILVCIPFALIKLSPMWKAGYIVSLILAGSLVAQGSYFQVKFHEALTDINQYQAGVSFSSLGGRFEMWKASGRMFRENPVFGVGVGDWGDEFHKTASESKDAAFLMKFDQPHNMYLEALSTRGLFGIISLLTFLLYPFVFVWKRNDQGTTVFRNLVIMTVLAMLISGLTDTLTIVRYVFIAYCILIGIGMSAFARVDETESENICNEN